MRTLPETRARSAQEAGKRARKLSSVQVQGHRKPVSIQMKEWTLSLKNLADGCVRVHTQFGRGFQGRLQLAEAKVDIWAKAKQPE